MEVESFVSPGEAVNCSRLWGYPKGDDLVSGRDDDLAHERTMRSSAVAYSRPVPSQRWFWLRFFQVGIRGRRPAEHVVNGSQVYRFHEMVMKSSVARFPTIRFLPITGHGDEPDAM